MRRLAAARALTPPHVSLPAVRVAGHTPLVSAIVEGYNEIQLATSVADTVAGLLAQDYPLDRIEVLLLGSTHEQSGRWAGFDAQALPFHRVTTVAADGLPYYTLKNRGADVASGEVLAFVDSDVRPGPTWVSSIVEAIQGGADATCGFSTVRSTGRVSAPRPVLEVAGSVCFGHTVPDDPHQELLDGRAIVAHNLGVRADTFRALRFDTREFGRNCGPAQLYEDLRNSGARIVFVAGQRAQHSFRLFGWFLTTFMVRVGYEEHVARRHVPTTHNRWLMRTGPAEPLLTMLLSVVWDVEAWRRYGRALGLSRRGRRLRLPLLLGVSVAGRLAGMVGGYAAVVRPERMKAWAETH